MNKKPTQQELWTNQMLEFLHQYFIGISNLTCSEERSQGSFDKGPQICPLVLNWGTLEKKNSEQGKAGLYLISRKDKQWIPVDLIAYEENDLGGYSEVEIKLRSGTTRRMKPSYELPQEEKIKVSGYTHQAQLPKEIFLKPEEIILFFNNSAKTANLEDAESIYLNDLWDLKEKIKWDQTASKKKIINWVEQKPDPDDKSYKISEWEQDYIFWLAHPDTTNEIKAHEVYQAQNTKEREQLWIDYKEGFSELRRVYGIRHLTSKKEDRQNNPEIELNEAQFVALERDKWRERMKSIKDFETKGGCEGTHTLSYGSYQEHQEALELEEAVEENDSTQKPETEWAQIKQGLGAKPTKDKEK